jgi:hypothetical protein
VFRFYKLADGSHFFTNNESEKNVVSQRPDIYRYEGVAFYEYTSQVANSVPVYRFYNFKQGVHFYTASQSEYQNVLTTGSWTYRYEGVAYYTLTAVSNGLAPVHRFYKFRQGVHFYTNNQAEATYLNNTAYSTYRYEGVAYYSPDHLSSVVAVLKRQRALFYLPLLLNLRWTIAEPQLYCLAQGSEHWDDYSLVANEIGATSFSAPVGVDEIDTYLRFSPLDLGPSTWSSRRPAVALLPHLVEPGQALRRCSLSLRGRTR